MEAMNEPKFGPNGLDVFNRTYSRALSDGTKESWLQTVTRCVEGNAALVYGHDQSKWSLAVHQEVAELKGLVYDFKVLPAGRHLWSGGVVGAEHSFNCWVAPHDSLADHLSFTMQQLMCGGGVGSRYGVDAHTYPAPSRALELHLVCDPEHADHAAMRSAGVLSTEFSDQWTGAYPVEDSREGWGQAMVDLVETYYRGDVGHTKRVYDLAHVRPLGARLKSFGGTASGPLPLAQLLHIVAGVMNRAARRGSQLTGLEVMEIDHAIGAAVVAGGARRSARMSIMSWRDPEIMAFVACKRDTAAMWSTNISVAVDGEFFAQACTPGSHASSVLRAIAEGMLLDGEPGVYNDDNANKGELKRVGATNPCGEIALEEREPCCLGQVNMQAMAHSTLMEIANAHRLLTRFLIRATFAPVSDPASRAVVDRNRRIGLGHTGIHGYLVHKGIRYSEAGRSKEFERTLSTLKWAVDLAARQYAFELRIPEPIKKTALAPTGTISKLPGCTEGIAPVFARYFIRRMRFSTSDPSQMMQLDAFMAQGYPVEPCVYSANTAVVEFPSVEALMEEVSMPELIETQDEISIEDRLALQALYQEVFVDNAISNTLSIDPASTSVDELVRMLVRWMPRLKGTTVFPWVSRPQSPYEPCSWEQLQAMKGAMVVAESSSEECLTGACPIR